MASLPEVITHLTTARAEKGLSLTETAAAIGVSKSRLHNWENRGNVPSWELLVRWAEVLDYRIDVTIAEQTPDTNRAELMSAISLLTPAQTAEALRLVLLLPHLSVRDRTILFNLFGLLGDDVDTGGTGEGA